VGGVAQRQLHRRHPDPAPGPHRLRTLPRLSDRSRAACRDVDDEVLHRHAGRDAGGRGCARRHASGQRDHPRARTERLRVGDGAAGHGHDDRLRVQRGLWRSERGDLGLQRRGESVSRSPTDYDGPEGLLRVPAPPSGPDPGGHPARARSSTTGRRTRTFWAGSFQPRERDGGDGACCRNGSGAGWAPSRTPT
jgi:hypothetical protein